MSRRRGSSIGKMDFGDTQGSSLTTARIENSRRSAYSSSRVDPAEAGESDSASSSRHRPGSEAAAALNGAHGAAATSQSAKAAKSVGSSKLSKSVKSRSSKLPKSAKSSTPLKKALRLLYRHTWLGPYLVLVLAYSWYFLSVQYKPDHWLNWCLKLSYPLVQPDGSVRYGEGYKDAIFIAFHVIVFTFIREFCMQVALLPLAKAFGLATKHKINRFIEQTYSMLYYGTMGPLGMFIMRYRCPELWFFNTTAFYEGFPHRDHDPWFKVFYMLQAAFWAQQALVLTLNLEKRRRDFRELVFHHIVTVALIYLSYRFHFTRMGLAVYITMDVSDFFLATSKTLNYLESPGVVPFFFVFVAVWAYLRHYVNIVILKSIWTEFATVGPFELNWETQQYKCWISQYITSALLLALQLVNLYWFFLIIKIALRYVFTGAKNDVRSDDEDESS